MLRRQLFSSCLADHCRLVAELFAGERPYVLPDDGPQDRGPAREGEVLILGAPWQQPNRRRLIRSYFCIDFPRSRSSPGPYGSLLHVAARGAAGEVAACSPSQALDVSPQSRLPQ